MLEYALCYLYRYQSATRINLFDITLRYLMIRFKNFDMKGLQKSYSKLYIFKFIFKLYILNYIFFILMLNCTNIEIHIGNYD